jgi:hypothetical protein
MFSPSRPKHEHSFKVKSVALVGPDMEALRALADPDRFKEAIDMALDSEEYINIAAELLDRSKPKTSVLRECPCGALEERVYQGDHTRAFREKA